MDSFGNIRLLARAKHAAIRAKANGNGKATALLAAARDDAGVKTRRLPAAHPLLSGGDGALHRNGTEQSIYIATEIGDEHAAFVEAHEFGHLWIETPDDAAIVPRGASPDSPEEPTPLGVRRVEAYSPQELRERYANVFAREFLLPREEARKQFLEQKRNAPKIASDLGLPPGLVHQQLAAALLLPDIVVPKEQEPTEKRPLDPSQRAAAEHMGSPLLVEAGPGTGKTRTLIGRIEYLLARKVPYTSILALTFSNKAAREIRDRVASTNPTAAPEIWAGTFHAFGLEILRKYGDLMGIKQPVRILDQADQLALLEKDLGELGLDHYLVLHEPLLDLKHILSAISRAKDELFSPEDYAAAAQKMAQAASNEELRIRSEKAAEVAKIYKHYETRLRAEGVLDFADLIGRTIELLDQHPGIKAELCGVYQHLLVDEYQDVNRASAVLLKALAGDGKGLWAVGDARQSIYRFRGAAPINTRDFEKDYPGAKRLPLAVNYRSVECVVEAFCTYADAMSVGKGRNNNLKAERSAGKGAIDFNIAADRAAEIAGMAEVIAKRKKDGIEYRDQAVLCRTHTHLERIGAGLEAAGVPVLYLGDLFERPEIKDLLSLLSFVSEPHRGGLYRLATMKRYRASLGDVTAFYRYAASTKKKPFEALADVKAIGDLSVEGRAGFQRLWLDVRDCGFKTSPGEFLCQVMFSHGDLLRDYLDGDSAADHQRRLALHQFLQFAIESASRGGEDPKRNLLDWIRRLEVFGDERALREAPSAVEGIDAVRLMTVHQSKGLEFRVVHLPALGKGMFPLSWSGNRCPPPEGMVPTVPKDDHIDEEQCLFFVALSRARDHLSLSRAVRYSDKQGSNPSDELAVLAGFLPRVPDGAVNWSGKLPVAPVAAALPSLGGGTKHDARDIEMHMTCGRRYLYQVVLALSGSREDNGYVRFHRAVYRVLGWLAEQTGVVTDVAVKAAFEGAWAEIGPSDHPLQTLYRGSAQKILDQAVGRPRDKIKVAQVLELTLDQHVLSVPIDEIEQDGSGIVIRRLRTGRVPTKPDQRALHALMAEAGRQKFGAGGRFEVHYLTANKPVPIQLKGVMADRLTDTRQSLADITAGRFPTTAKRDECPRCPHYFICPSLPE